MRWPSRVGLGNFLPLALAVAFVAGAWLRLDQLADQVLIEDEWHPVHQVTYYTLKHVLLSFGNADYSIPLVLLYFLEAGVSGLSELQLRLPMVVAGIATVVALPLMLRGRLEERILAMFAVLLAVAPFLVSYSRIARPYAITLLGVYFAFWLCARAVRPGRMDWRMAWGYSIVCGLVVWMHTVTGPMLIAPLIATWWCRSQRDAVAWRPLAVLTCLTGFFMALAILPPLLGDPQAIAGKAGIDTINLGTVIGAWHLYVGSGSTVIACLVAILAIAGFTTAWRSSPIIRWIWLGTELTVVVLLISRPWWVDRSLAFGRYLLPALPAILLAVSAGLAKALDALQRLLGRAGMASRAWGTAAFVLLMLGWAQSSPYPELLRAPNSYTQHSYFQYDYRKAMNPVRLVFDGSPVSQFWSTLASAPPGTLTVAVAPFNYSTYYWQAPLWERASAQRVIPAYLWGTCEASRHGEVPADARFRFRNAIHLTNSAEWPAHHVDYIAYAKGASTTSSDPLPKCEAWMRRRFGEPYREDAGLIVWRAPAGTTAAEGRVSETNLR